jgi:hypothetical protein
MPDRIDNLKIISSGGLNSNENHLNLSDNDPGVATRLVNFEPSLFGGYRRISGFQSYKEDYAEVTNSTNPATGPVLCVAIFKNDYLGTTRVIAARKITGTTTYGFYQYIPLNGWELISGAPTPSMTDGSLTVAKLRHIQFDFGDGNKIVFVDGVNSAVVYDSQNWFTLTTSGAGTSVSPGGNQILAKPAVVDVFENHIFLSGAEASDAVVCHSAPNDPLDFTVASGAGQLTVGTSVVNIKPFRDQLFVFGSNAIKKITADVATGNFLTENVTSNVGCLARDSVVEIGGDLMFLAPDGFRPVAGTSRIGDVELETISKSIQGAVVDLIENFDMSTVNSVVIRSKSQVRFFFGDASIASTDSVGIIGGLSDSSGSIEWEFGTLLGIRANCTTSGYIGTEELILHGDYDGKVYQQEKGRSLAGQDMISIYSTPYLDFGDAGVRKYIRKINTFIRAEGPVEINLALSYDWGDYNTARPSTYTQASAGAPTAYGGRNIRYGAANIIYGGSEKPIMATDVQGSGYSVRATFVTVGQFEPFSIQGLVIEYSAAGRR